MLGDITCIKLIAVTFCLVVVGVKDSALKYEMMNCYECMFWFTKINLAL